MGDAQPDIRGGNNRQGRGPVSRSSINQERWNSADNGDFAQVASSLAGRYEGQQRGHNRGSGNGRTWAASRDEDRRTWVPSRDNDRRSWVSPGEEPRAERWLGSSSGESGNERRRNYQSHQDMNQGRGHRNSGRGSGLGHDKGYERIPLNGHQTDRLPHSTPVMPASDSQWSQQDARMQRVQDMHDSRSRDHSDQHQATILPSHPVGTGVRRREESSEDSFRTDQTRRSDRGGDAPRQSRANKESSMAGLRGEHLAGSGGILPRRDNAANGNIAYRDSDWDYDPRGGPSSSSPFSTDSTTRSYRGGQGRGGRGGRGRGRSREDRTGDFGGRGRGGEQRGDHHEQRGSSSWRSESGEESRIDSGRGGRGRGGRGQKQDDVNRSHIHALPGTGVQLRPWHQQHSRGGDLPSRVSKLVAGMAPSLETEDKSKPQLLQTLEEKLWTGGVDCMICWDSVAKAASVWSCDNCYAIFHLRCVSKWAVAATSSDTAAVRQSSQPQADNWRCPGCQKVHAVSKKELRYMCFCNAMVDPPQDPYITPHSCGQTCRKSLHKAASTSDARRSALEYRCPHLCTLRCHPGPCPPCKAMAPSLPCHCGKSFVTKRCAEVEKGGWSCGSKCGHPLQCGRHSCEEVCHEGACPPCAVVHVVPCYCGHDRKDVSCNDLAADEKPDAGCFSCGRACGNLLPCGLHACRRACHAGACGDCQLAPSRVHTCPCGKASLRQISAADSERTACTDPIPTCFDVCGKKLPCEDHTCPKRCHEGDCPPCEVMVNKKCRCGMSSRRACCSGKRPVVGEGLPEDEEGEFVCGSKCGRKKSCGRHRCNGFCCPIRHDGPEVAQPGDPHLCTLICGKKLRCGVHQCEELCHSGHCPPCMNLGFSELSCACGQTSVLPPVPCGTPTPQCPHTCAVPQPCGHPARHLCHFGDCPPCTVSVQRKCIGGHMLLSNILCGSKDVKCSAKCGKLRRCGAHRCLRGCHGGLCDVTDGGSPSSMAVTALADGGSPSARAAAASANGSGGKSVETAPPAAPTVLGKRVLSCGQTCGEKRRDCGHPCASACHPGTPCPETRCRALVTISCRCGHLTAQVPCGSGTGGGGLVEAACVAKLPSGLAPLDNGGASSSWLTSPEVPLGKRQLNCDEDCARLERKRMLAAAFGAGDADDLVAREGPEAELAECLRWNPQWVHGAEARLHYLLYAPSSAQASGTAPPRHVGIGSGASRVRVHVFHAVPRAQRACLHQLADRWGMVSTSVGRDPGRFVVIVAGPKSKVPSRGLLSRGPTLSPGQVPLPAISAELDVDPACVVAFVDLPQEEQLEQLNFTFGGDCELHWVNDRNAVAVFTDPERAATAMRRLDHTCVYWGASGPPPGSSKGKAIGASVARGEVRTKPGVPGAVGSTSWQGDAWGEEEGKRLSLKLAATSLGGASRPGTAAASGATWKAKDTGSITVEANFWNALEDGGNGETPKGGGETGTRTTEVAKSESAPSGAAPAEEEEEWEKVLDTL